MTHEGHLTDKMRQCIQECLTCHAICTETTEHCLTIGGHHAGARHIGILLACAEICQTSANFMLRGSEFHTRTCAVCAEICRACAADCEQIAPDDAMMKRCAEACRRCAASCASMSSSRATGGS